METVKNKIPGSKIKRKKLTKEERETIIVELQKNSNLRNVYNISLSYGVSAATIERIRLENNIEREDNRINMGRVDESTKNEIINFFKSNPYTLEKGGCNLTDIANRYRLSLATIYNYRKAAKDQLGASITGMEKEEILKGEDANTTVENNEVKESTTEESVATSEDTSSVTKKVIVKINPEFVSNPKLVKQDIKFSHLHTLFGINKIKGILTPYSDGTTDDCIEAGLIADRHNMPTMKYIFSEALDGNLMFNYAEQEKICKEFLDKEVIRESGNKKLVLYTSGLQCTLGSVIKVCSDNKIDLAIKHFNSDTNNYVLQTIFGDFSGYDKPSSCFGELPRKQGLFFYNCKQEDLESEGKSFYCLMCSKFVDGTYDRDNSVRIFVKDFNSIWEILPGMVNTIQHSKDSLGIFTNKCTCKNNRVSFLNSICKCYNFTKDV